MLRDRLEGVERLFMDRNIELISITEAAKLLGVSVSTVRRWSDNGDLPCYRVGQSKYRRFDRVVIEKLKDEYYGEKNLITAPPESQEMIITKNIPAQSHPAHYLMHKYWGRKAHNIVSEYISCFTKEGDTVLEPFMGSGVTVIEALKLKRKVIGIDINPISKFIVENTINNVDLKLFTNEYQSILTETQDKFQHFYNTSCHICGRKSCIETAIWENDTLVKIKAICPVHGTFIREPSDIDFETYSLATEMLIAGTENGSIDYPKDDIMAYVKRSGRTKINELFSNRALIILSYLRERILKVEDINVQQLLLFCFTSMLSNVSKMLPGDKEKATYKSGWVISKFWTPKIHTERNIFMCLQLRYKAILKGKSELQDIDSSLSKLYTRDSCDLSYVSDQSIDYIFTDPPYGESIAYLALSHFWNAWLNKNISYEKEIIIDPYRKKGYDDYEARIKKAYSELYRVLKDGHYMSFTFHNRDLVVWKAILDACTEAGFILENIILQEQAVSSGTQGINRKNTLTGDFIYNFKKDTALKQKQIQPVANPVSFIIDSIRGFIKRKNGATPSELYEFIIPIIVKNNAYTDENGNVINIENVLKQHFDYVEVTTDEKEKLGGAFKWVEKNN